MPDIALRFHKDMLVLSAPIDTALARQGVDVSYDREFISLIEPEVVHDAYRLESIAGAQCLVTNSAGITKARLAHVNMEDRALELAEASLTIVNTLKPQHVLAEIGPTRLPLDESSANSLKQNRDQYADAARAFGQEGFDAFFLNGMMQASDMQCALMGVRKVSDKPVFASMDTEGDGQALADACAMMVEHGADVVGFTSAAPLDEVAALVECVKKVVDVPLLVQLRVLANNPQQQAATEENPYYCADVLVDAATRLRGAGVQFLRACGDATPAYTGALVAASAGFDVLP